MLHLSVITVELDPTPKLALFHASSPAVGNPDASTINSNENMLAEKITSQEKIENLDSMEQGHSRQITDEEKTETVFEPLQLVIQHVQ